MSTAKKRELAAQNALYEAQQLNGGSVLETAPRFAQKGVGRVALMYKTYGIQMYYTMLKTAEDHGLNVERTTPRFGRLRSDSWLQCMVQRCSLQGYRGYRCSVHSL